MLRSLLVGIFLAFTQIQFDTVCDVINSSAEWIFPDSVWQAQESRMLKRQEKKVDEKISRRGGVVASRNADCEPA